VPRGGYQTAKALRNAEYVPIVGMGHDLPRGAWPIIVSAIERAARRSPVLVQTKGGGLGDDDA
jgi:hypothetical protein